MILLGKFDIQRVARILYVHWSSVGNKNLLSDFKPRLMSSTCYPGLKMAWKTVFSKSRLVRLLLNLRLKNGKARWLHSCTLGLGGTACEIVGGTGTACQIVGGTTFLFFIRHRRMCGSFVYTKGTEFLHNCERSGTNLKNTWQSKRQPRHRGMYFLGPRFPLRRFGTHRHSDCGP